MLYNWLKIFFRNFKRNPLYPTVNLLGLTAGITCFLLAMLYVSHEYSYEKWNPNLDRIYRSASHLPDGQIYMGLPGPMVIAFTEAYPAIEDYMVYRQLGEPLVSYGDNLIYGSKIGAHKNYFEFFPFPFKYGNPKSALEHPNDVALSEEIALKIFGDIDPIGKIIKVDNDEEYKVTGVFETNGYPSHIAEYNIVTQYPEEDFANNDWGNFNFNTFFKVSANFDQAKVEREMNNFHRRIGAKEENISEEEYGKKFNGILGLENLDDIHLYGKYLLGKGSNTVFILSLLSLLILLISAINFVNLSISGATKRAKEVAVRKTLGSNKSGIVWQFVTEVAVLCGIAILISLALTELLLPSFSSLLGVELSILDVAKDLPLLASVIGAVLLIAGLFPALYLANFKPVNVLKGNFSRSKSGAILKKAMIVFQFAASAIFLVGAYIVYEQVDYMNNRDLGFNKEHIVIINSANASAVREKHDLYRNELKQINGVKMVSLSDRPPGTASGDGSVSQTWYKDRVIAGDIHFIGPDFIETMGISLLQGEMLTESMVLDTVTNHVLVNETLLKMLEIDDPIGKNIRFWGETAVIVGVVQDYITKGFDSAITPALFNPSRYARRVMVKVKSENLEQTISAMENIWTSKIEPGFPFRYEFMDDNFAKVYESQTKLQTLVSALSAIMVLIALLGLFAVATHTIQQRYKEVAIRKTLGASEMELMMGLIKDFVVICLTGVAIALPIAYMFTTTWLEGFVYRIDMPILPYVFVPILVTILTILMVWTQAGRALKLDLVKYLKYE